jgi:hypothetical protein
MRHYSRTLTKALMLLAFTAVGLFGQAESGDKEVGLGGQFVFQSAQGTSVGTAAFQASFGYFGTAKNYFGFEADPLITLSHSDATPGETVAGKPCTQNASGNASGCYGGSAASSSTDFGGFFGANYRRMLGAQKGKVFLFVGGGGGLYVLAGSGGSTSFGTVFPEVGFKTYISQKSSLEFSYKMLVELNGIPAGSSFSQRIENQVTASIRHIF